MRCGNVACGGWAFEFENDIYPDIDDTAVVVLALLEAGAETEVRAAVDRAVEWVLATRSGNGAWGAFDKDNTREIVYKLPFADLNYQEVSWTANGGKKSILEGFFFPQAVAEADLIVSLPKMKTHHWVGVTHLLQGGRVKWSHTRYDSSHEGCSSQSRMKWILLLCRGAGLCVKCLLSLFACF